MIDTILANLPDTFPWKNKIHHFDVIDSTNTRAKKMAAEGAPHGTVLIADQQTGGRGRLGRSFHSPAGSGIYLSVILRPQCHASELMHLTCATGAAMCDAVESACGIRPGIKWTNDLVFQKRKLGGILTELSLTAEGNVAYAVVGIGINCTQSEMDFPEDIRPIATSLRLCAKDPIDRRKVIAAMLIQLENMSQSLLTRKEQIMNRYRRDCITVGQEISVIAGENVRYGTALSVDEDGALVVRFSDGHTEAVGSGEVSIRGMYGYIQ